MLSEVLRPSGKNTWIVGVLEREDFDRLTVSGLHTPASICELRRVGRRLRHLLARS